VPDEAQRGRPERGLQRDLLAVAAGQDQVGDVGRRDQQHERRHGGQDGERLLELVAQGLHPTRRRDDRDALAADPQGLRPRAMRAGMDAHAGAS